MPAYTQERWCFVLGVISVLQVVKRPVGTDEYGITAISVRGVGVVHTRAGPTVCGCVCSAEELVIV